MKDFNKIKIYCDFDGTITKKDLGDDIFKRQISIEPENSNLKSSKINIYDYWHKLCSKLPKGLTIRELIEGIDEYEIDEYFKDFLNYCYESSIEIEIVSDGFDAYIVPILEKYKIDLKLSCNHLIECDGQIVPRFKNASESCKCFSANCKRNYVLNNTQVDTLKIYIGDGYSDYCAAQHCDVIFAKKSLATFCNENSLPHHNYKTFFDVKRVLKQLIKDKKLKKRNNAFVLSKKAYQYE